MCSVDDHELAHRVARVHDRLRNQASDATRGQLPQLRRLPVFLSRPDVLEALRLKRNITHVLTPNTAHSRDTTNTRRTWFSVYAMATYGTPVTHDAARPLYLSRHHTHNPRATCRLHKNKKMIAAANSQRQNALTLHRVDQAAHTPAPFIPHNAQRHARHERTNQCQMPRYWRGGLSIEPTVSLVRTPSSGIVTVSCTSAAELEACKTATTRHNPSNLALRQRHCEP